MKTIRLALRPTSRQVDLLHALLAEHCDLYNAALQERKEAYKAGTKITWVQQAAQIKDIRKLDPEYERWSSQTAIATIRKLDKAFQSFFRRVKAGQTPGYPRFKSKRRYDSAEFPIYGNGCKLHYTSGRNGKLYLKGIGHVTIRMHKVIAPNSIRTITVKREGKRWFAFVVHDAAVEPKPRTGAMVGLDMATGSNGLAYGSDGQKIDNPQYVKHAADKLAKAQQELSRKKKGSNRRRKAVHRVADNYRKVANARRFYLHKVSTELVREYDYIAIEDLQIANMTRKPKPKQDESGEFIPNGAAAKAGLNKSILDSGWGMLRQFLTYKVEDAGKQLVAVDPKFTSQTCHSCGQVDKQSRSGKLFLCTACGHQEDADVNAARNILRAGLALQPMAVNRT